MTFLFGLLVALPACLGTTALGAAAMSDAAAKLFLGERFQFAKHTRQLGSEAGDIWVSTF